MPLGFQVVLDLDLNGFISFREIWRECSSGQTATSLWFFHCKKCSTGGFSSLEIFFWFPLSIALSGLFLFDEHHRRRDAKYF
uniref:Uncharacterized protein n=1 Tax=Rhizophora mucronata TaxID=61149 RepID=A0A2P2MHM0_RHIMU